VGLDMYLTVSEYVSRTDRSSGIRNGTTPVPNDLFTVMAMRHPAFVDQNSFSGISVEYPAGYWRKANAVHNWFVQNVQDDRDECQKSYVGWDQLEELKKACYAVLDAQNNSLVSVGEVAIEVGLAPKSGFFFGSTEYDEWYFEDLRHTVEIIERLARVKVWEGPYDIFYQASW
jgi:hypothetical protein